MATEKSVTKSYLLKTFLMLVVLMQVACGRSFQMVGSANGNLDSSSLNTRQLVAPHLKYFGFYASSMAGLKDVAEEISGFSNISWVADRGGGEVARIEYAKKYNLKVVVDVERMFFDENFRLYPDHVARWNTFADSVRPYVNDGTIVAFYPLDEPFTAKKMKLAGQNKQERVVTLEQVGAVIKGSFSDVAIGMVLGGDQWSGYIVPYNFDWIGYDVYDCWENCSGHSYEELYGRLVSNLRRPDQRIMMVPDTWKWSPGHPDEVEELQMILLFNKYVDFAKNHNRVIGLFNFIYQDLPERNSKGEPTGRVYPGLNQLSYLKKRVAAIGAQLKNNGAQPMVESNVAHQPAPVASAPAPQPSPPAASAPAPTQPAPVQQTPVPPTSNNPPAPPSTLSFNGNGFSLKENESIETSSLKLVMQGDSNLVLYRKSDGKPLWASNTVTTCQVKPCAVYFQGDGNLVIYQNDGKPVAASHTVGGSRFEMNDQAPHLRIYGGASQQLIWSRP